MLVPLGTATALMCFMAVKHFCADFLFQTSWIARGKAGETGWLLPLLLHAGGHAVFTLALALLLAPTLWWIAPVELALHAIIDRVKVLVGRRAHLAIDRSEYWWLFGFDQLLHQITNVAIICAFLAEMD